MAQCGTQASCLDVMIGRCSTDSHCHPGNVGCSFFWYTNNGQRNHTNLRRKHKTWTMEGNQFALHCYFRSNPTQRGYRKRMIEIWQKGASFQTTSQRLSDQVRTIIKKGWFSDLEILEIHQKTNNNQDTNTITDTLSIDKQEQSNRNELPTSKNRNTTQLNNTQPNNTEQALTQEQKLI